MLYWWLYFEYVILIFVGFLVCYASYITNDSVNMTMELLTSDTLDSVEVLPLGSGGEVGRSCVVVTFKGKRVMFDCGLHPARMGLDSLPILDNLNCGSIDLVLVTHFHLDHCGALPYLCNATNFEGKVFMTHPTKAIYRKVMLDFMRVSPNSSELVKSQWLDNTMEVVQTTHYHKREACGGICFTAYNAGHVLGAAMFLVEIGGAKVLYTGDYSRYPDRHLVGAETPPHCPDVLIVESTYGIQIHESREDREAKFLNWVTEVIQSPRKGKCLVPVFALGRAQELLLLLDEYWEQHEELRSVPIYFISSMSTRCSAFYETYRFQMNENIKHGTDNPFDFKYITCLKDLSNFHDFGPCVVLASPGMLQSGVSRQLFERWCIDRRNGVILAGYSVEGTLAKSIMSHPKEINGEDGRVLPLRMETIHTVSFSAHSDYAQTHDFIQSLPTLQHVILVHGHSEAMAKLSERLNSDFSSRPLTALTTLNTKPICIPLRATNHASALGTLASELNHASTSITRDAILITQADGTLELVNRGDLEIYSGLRTARLHCGMRIPVDESISLRDVYSHLCNTFQNCILHSENSAIGDTVFGHRGNIEHKIVVAKAIIVELNTVTNSSENNLVVKWNMSKHTDVIANAVCITLLQLHHLEKLQVGDIQSELDMSFRMRSAHHFLSQHFQGVQLDYRTGEMTFRHEKGGNVTITNLQKVECDDQDAKVDVERVVRRMFLALFPIPLLEGDGLCECPSHVHENAAFDTS